MATAIGADWLASQAGNAPLTTNQEGSDVPFQRWYRFKEAFSPHFVRDAFLEAKAVLGRDLRTCLDPFGGSGTTALTAQFLGVRPTTIEVNPFLADLAAAKLTTYDVGRLLIAHASLLEELSFAGDARPDPDELFPGAPATFVEPGLNDRWIFDRSVARRIWSYRRALERMPDRVSARLFRVLLGSILIGVSNVVVSGKGRRYRKASRWSLHSPQEVDDRFQRALERAVDDLVRFSSRRCSEFTVLRGDARKLIQRAENVDLVLFSPPYPNSFDYTDIYNVELWALGYLTSGAENTALRTATLRSHVQIKRDFAVGDLDSLTLRRTTAALDRAKDDLWDPHLPSMVGAYFDDLMTVLRAASERLVTRGLIMMVVGDSRYAGIHIDVEQIVRELVPQAQLRVRDAKEVRSMRTSAQQGGAFALSERLLVIDRAPLTTGAEARSFGSLGDGAGIVARSATK